jgi:hypothetical protein
MLSTDREDPPLPALVIGRPGALVARANMSARLDQVNPHFLRPRHLQLAGSLIHAG